MAQEYDITVEGRAYLLRPDTPKEGTKRQPKPGQNGNALSEPLKSNAEEAGLVMKLPPLYPNTMYSLEATEHAQQQGKFMEFHKAAYKALWEDGQDLGDLSVIGSVAESVGLDSADLVPRLESNEYSSTVMEQYQEALGYGVRGIPTFVIGNLMFSGAQPYQVFKSAMERVLAD